jgi:hypothetical protein
MKNQANLTILDVDNAFRLLEERIAKPTTREEIYKIREELDFWYDTCYTESGSIATKTMDDTQFDLAYEKE